jgi:hypothetical protein
VQLTHDGGEAAQSTPKGGGGQLFQRGDGGPPNRQSARHDEQTGSGPDAAGAPRSGFTETGLRRPRFSFKESVPDDLDEPAAVA